MYNFVLGPFPNVYVNATWYQLLFDIGLVLVLKKWKLFDASL